MNDQPTSRNEPSNGNECKGTSDGEHEWYYDGGDPDTGVTGAWLCRKCDAVDIDTEPPAYADDY